MKKRESKHNRKVRKLVVVCVLCGILLTVSTYAWFIGMKTVKVNSFDIEIASTEGLFLSMDGEKWSYNLDAKNATPYANHANQFLDEEDENGDPISAGLIPMSTVGDMTKASSRMKLFEKGSLTATKGGYRLLTSQVDNNTKQVTGGTEYLEGDGYVAFDLFIKNLSGDAYYPTNDPLNEEAIYLQYDSEVKVGSTGVSNTGIENSVRVAFAQLGRVSAETEDVATITGITCSDVKDGTDTVVTGICRDAAIWEPNDTKHVTNAINYYNTSCLKRDTAKTTEFAYKTTDNVCGTVTPGVANSTYAVSRELGTADVVDVYDGAQFNGFGSDTVAYKTYKDATDKTQYKLVDYDYFTDTEKMKKGNQRLQIMSLAPNSITKVRVYIYIEGQDIDNYDFAQLGKQISVKFGFTKERYTGEGAANGDIDYSGPSLEQGVDETTQPADPEED